MIKSLFKHSTIYFSGLFVSKLLTTIVWILIARLFAPVIFGQVVLYLTFIQLATYFANFGLNQWYQKQIEHHQYQRGLLLNKILNARLITLFLSLIILGFFLFFTKSFSLSASIFTLLTLIPDSFLAIGEGYYLEQKKGLRVALKSASMAVVIFIALPFIKQPFLFEKITVANLLAELVTVLWFYPWFEFKNFCFVSFKQSLQVLRSSINYALLIFTSFFYARGDHLVINYSLGAKALGLYGAAYRYLEALSLIPTALSHNLFPISAKKQGVSRDSLVHIVGLMVVSGLIISIFLFFLSNFLVIKLIGPAYGEVIQPLKIFSVVLFLFFVNAPLSTVVQSSNYLKSFLPYGIINTVLNIILNLVLVTRYGIVSAAWVMLITEVTGLLINYYFIKKIYCISIGVTPLS
ncbi:hypothetical protein COS31_05110 [Candidatus Roizmanbacteria bacterium CG02_land_8_20_14_3_00_36_15]|uniref:Uncharacterized protein n=2 Tax=Candidatus Roizmaniibacteriota TaxID=1752723 RepID=A0A2M8KJP4_9BACT|nr:MAG: hypothetical protein COS51_00095 [Candidatus Roizmanbacteria bacterium CG03_land_8_20_14_0_80_36_21]PIV37358.1 MAG: hypothetical protein COS31_05110 [Candidatus Roizmanbacteria bacterium CG02_land_8_20_14_3_00_36_15]PJA53617.1 MAG: hypothetical protein CO166_01205 [Candidatus Roizmanbacteria bacterium CG_4_9_14_3_um_filter_36_11]PJE60140.1 MAG: hypothetical protein COU86_05950 [Candidatus Roizmanbacteria bacterium CG10_big_fil_rev_8_21_14_0_10_36_26]